MHTACRKKVYEITDNCPVCRWSWGEASIEECQRVAGAKGRPYMKKQVQQSLLKYLEIADSQSDGDMVKMAHWLHTKEIITDSPHWEKTWKWLEPECELDSIRETAVRDVSRSYEDSEEYVRSRIERLKSGDLDEKQTTEVSLSLLYAFKKLHEIISRIIKEATLMIMREPDAINA